MKNNLYLKCFFIVLFGALILQVLVFCLPNTPIRNNIKQSFLSIENRELHDHPFYKDTNYVGGDTLDGFTDFLILNISYSKNLNGGNNSRLYKSLFLPMYYDGNSEKDSLIKISSDEQTFSNLTYQRYWHGDQIIVRPLLLFFNYDQILYIISIISYILLFISIFYVRKNLNVYYALFFAITMILINFPVVSESLQYFPIFWVTLIGTIIINKLYEKKCDQYYPIVFMIIGMLSSYFDLLTVPVLSLGINLTIVLLLNHKDNKNNFKKIFLDLIKYSIIWTISYAFMFLSKWIIASLISGDNEILNSYKAMSIRFDGNVNNINPTAINAIKYNLGELLNKPLIIIIIIVLVIWFIEFLKLLKNKKIKKSNIMFSLMLTIICLYPYIWYSIIKNHSIIHFWMTYRLQGITIFAGLSALYIIIENKLNNKNGKMKIYGRKNKRVRR